MDVPKGDGTPKRSNNPNGALWKVDLKENEGMDVRSHLVPLIDDKDGYIVLGRSGSAHKKWRKKGLLEIGAVGEHQESGKDHFSRKVYLDAAFPHIVFVCGKRGSGKSYTLGIFAEELMRSAIGVGVVMIDPIGIFWSIKDENRSIKEKQILKKWGLQPHSFPELKVLVPEGSVGETASSSDGVFSIGVGEMTAEDWCQVFDLDRFKTQGLLVGQVLEMVRNGYESIHDGKITRVRKRGDRYSITHIIRCLERSVDLTSKTGGYTPQTRRSIVARFNAAAGWGIFSMDGTPIREITSPNRATVLDVSNPRLGDEKRSLITGIVARKILSGRIHSARIEESGVYDENDPDLIPITWLLIDEAHIILPHKGQTPATEALVEYAKQGRRPGCALVLATQRPASTTDEILSQVDLLIGHNLALEDDMTALRRRVPAKLPPEFANSDFIRAIPVGTAIMADQRTQQRSFLMKVRPRFSHHAGSSSMPKAFLDKKKPPVQRPPVSREAGMEGAVDSIPVMDIRGSEATMDIRKGSSYFVLDHSKELMTSFLRSFEEGTEAILFSRMPANDYPMPDHLSVKRRYWLSSTPGEDHIPPTSLQEISMESDIFFGDKEGRMVILDGLDYITANNGMEPVKKLIEVLHEKAILSSGMFVYRGDLGMEERMLDLLSTEADSIIGERQAGETEKKIPDNDTSADIGIDGPIGRQHEDVITETLSDTYEDEVSLKISNGGEDTDTGGEYSSSTRKLHGILDRDDLEWMCSVLDLSSEGTDDEILDRILAHENELGLNSDGDRTNNARQLMDLLESTKDPRKENEELRKKIAKLEKELSKRPKKKRNKKDILLLEWSDETGKEINRIADDLKEVREELEDHKRESNNIGGSIPILIERIDEDRDRNLERLTALEEVVKERVDSLRNEISSGSRTDTEKSHPEKKTLNIEPVPIDRSKKLSTKVVRPKKKVLKKGAEAVAIMPLIGMKEATDAAKKTIKRSLFRGPKEVIDNIMPVYLPLYRYLLGYKGALFKGQKEGDLYIDAILGEIVTASRSGLRRSKGLGTLSHLTDIEKRVYRSMGSSSKEDIKIAHKASMAIKDTRRALTSLQKKGVVTKTTIEGNVNLFEVSENIEIPKRPWTRESGFNPDWVEGIEERFIDPVLPRKDVDRMIGVLSDDVQIIQCDLVRYPFYIISITGQGRTRVVAVDGVSGDVDNDLKSSIVSILKTLSS